VNDLSAVTYQVFKPEHKEPQELTKQERTLIVIFTYQLCISGV